jgi:mannose-6-phosphate isomerase
LLPDVIQDAPEFYLGKEFFKKNGADLGFLLKILDSCMRLHVQVHPTAEFAQRYLNFPYGKLECYYIFAVRPGTNPYIRLGFQHLPSRNEWKRIILEQDIPAMDACFEPVPVAVGDILYIPGGVPHAIGENILMLEIMEPSDLVVRCEFEREGVVVPPEARFMGKDLDFCLDVFHYEENSVAEITEKYWLKPLLLKSLPGVRHERLVGSSVTSKFQVERLCLKPGASFSLDGGVPQVGVVIKGALELYSGGERETLTPGQSIFCAAAGEQIQISALGEEDAEFVAVIPHSIKS